MDPSSGTNDAYVTASLTTVDANGGQNKKSHILYTCSAITYHGPVSMQNAPFVYAECQTPSWRRTHGTRERTRGIQLAFSSAQASACGTDALYVQTVGQRRSRTLRFDRLLHLDLNQLEQPSSLKRRNKKTRDGDRTPTGKGIRVYHC